MFEFIKNLFVSNNIPSISFLELYKKLIGLSESKIYPFPYNTPQAISFPEDFWKDIIRLHKATLADELEREISLFYADGECVTTSTVKGSTDSVKSNHSVSVKYVPHPAKKNYYRKEIYVDGKVEKRIDIYYKQVPKEIQVKYLFNLHTHPSHTDAGGETYFNFFSKQDIQSLITTGAVITGLVTDKLWLIMRTNETPSSISLEDRDISASSVRDIMKLSVYCAEYYKKAIRQ